MHVIFGTQILFRHQTLGLIFNTKHCPWNFQCCSNYKKKTLLYGSTVLSCFFLAELHPRSGMTVPLSQAWWHSISKEEGTKDDPNSVQERGLHVLLVHPVTGRVQGHAVASGWMLVSASHAVRYLVRSARQRDLLVFFTLVGTRCLFHERAARNVHGALWNNLQIDIFSTFSLPLYKTFFISILVVSVLIALHC